MSSLFFSRKLLSTRPSDCYLRVRNVNYLSVLGHFLIVDMSGSMHRNSRSEFTIAQKCAIVATNRALDRVRGKKFDAVYRFLSVVGLSEVVFNTLSYTYVLYFNQ